MRRPCALVVSAHLSPRDRKPALRSVIVARVLRRSRVAEIRPLRFISIQDQVDTDSPMGRAMFTIIGAMAELESSLISERVTAGMKAAEARGKHLGRPATSHRIVSEIEALAASTDLSIRQIQGKIAGRASRGIVGEIAKRARAIQPSAL
jgi:DNA invertase Pin-like site-specific DNA recombinase